MVAVTLARVTQTVVALTKVTRSVVAHSIVAKVVQSWRCLRDGAVMTARTVVTRTVVARGGSW